MADMGFGGNWGGSSYGAYEGEGGYTGEGSPAQLGSQEFGTQGSINNQTKANGTNPGTKKGVESTLAPINLTRVISEQAISKPNTRDIDFQENLTAQQAKQSANVKAMYSQLQATEEQRADFKSGRNIMDKAVGYAKNYFSDPLAPGKHVADFGVRNTKGFKDRTDMSDREVNAFEVAMAIPTNPFTLPFTALSVDKMSKKQGRGGPGGREFSPENPYGTAGAYGISKEARGIAGPTAPEGSPNESAKTTAVRRKIPTVTPNSTSLAISPTSRRKSTMSAGNVYRRGNRGVFYV